MSDEKKKVPVREMKIYQTDDGRRLEVFHKVPDTLVDVRDLNEDDKSDIDNLNQIDTIYVGVAHIGTEYGLKEIRFEIPDCSSVSEAFSKYNDCAQKEAENFLNKLQESVNNAKNIMTANEHDLEMLDKMAQNSNPQ